MTTLQDLTFRVKRHFTTGKWHYRANMTVPNTHHNAPVPTLQHRNTNWLLILDDPVPLEANIETLLAEASQYEDTDLNAMHAHLQKPEHRVAVDYINNNILSNNMYVRRIGIQARDIIVTKLTTRGYTIGQIAQALHMNHTTIRAALARQSVKPNTDDTRTRGQHNPYLGSTDPTYKYVQTIARRFRVWCSTYGLYTNFAIPDLFVGPVYGLNGGAGIQKQAIKPINDSTPFPECCPVLNIPLTYPTIPLTINDNSAEDPSDQTQQTRQPWQPGKRKQTKNKDTATAATTTTAVVSPYDPHSPLTSGNIIICSSLARDLISVYITPTPAPQQHTSLTKPIPQMAKWKKEYVAKNYLEVWKQYCEGRLNYTIAIRA